MTQELYLEEVNRADRRFARWEARRRSWLARRLAEHSARITLSRNKLVALEKAFIELKKKPFPVVAAERSKPWVAAKAEYDAANRRLKEETEKYRIEFLRAQPKRRPDCEPTPGWHRRADNSTGEVVWVNCW